MILRIAFLLATGLALAGCSPGLTPPVAQLAKPRAALMEPPKPLPDVPEKTDLYQSDATCSAEYVRETGRLKSLQTYIRTIQKK